MLLLDENISHRNIPILSIAFTGIKHIKDFTATGATDADVWQIAKTHHLTIVTFDSDYEDMLNMKGFPPKIIWLRFGNSSNHTTTSTLLFHKETIINFINSAIFGILEINEAVL